LEIIVTLELMLTLLVENWRRKEIANTAKMPLDMVIGVLGGDNWKVITEKTSTAEIVELIIESLSENGNLRLAYKSAAQYKTKEDLLHETSLMGVIHDWSSS
jgi:hypothetical protein